MIYNCFRRKLLELAGWATQDFQVTVVTADYVPEPYHTTMGDIPQASRLATASLTGKRISDDGTAVADDVRVDISGVPSAIVVHRSSGELIAYLPILPEERVIYDGEITISWSDHIGGVFRL